MIGRSHREQMNLETHRQIVEWPQTSSVLASSNWFSMSVPHQSRICKNQHTYKWSWPQMSSGWNCRIISVEICPCRLFRLLQSCPSISLLQSFVVLTLAFVMEDGVGLTNPQNKSRFWTWRVVLHTTFSQLELEEEHGWWNPRQNSTHMPVVFQFALCIWW